MSWLRRLTLDGGENVMAVTMRQKKALIWGLGILIVVVLANVAWAQIGSGLFQCFRLL